MKLPSVSHKSEYVVYAFLILLVSGIFLSENFVKNKYRSIIANKAVLSAFTSEDISKIKSVSKDFNFDFQLINRSQVSYNSNPGLPELKFVSIYRPKVSTVLEEDLFESLRKLNPYLVFNKGKLLLVFPVYSNDETKNQYIVFAKILP